MQAIALVRRAAIMLGDPSMTWITAEAWLELWNISQEDLGTRSRLLQKQLYFDVDTDDAYGYPPRMTQLTEVEFTSTPTDTATFRPLKEIKTEDEFRQQTAVRYPQGEPQSYFARAAWLHLVPKPDIAYTQGGRLTCWMLPAVVTDLNAATIEFPDFALHKLLERLVIAGKFKRTRTEEAQAEYAVWLNTLDAVNAIADDRSRDAKTSYRPRSLKTAFSGMT